CLVTRAFGARRWSGRDRGAAARTGEAAVDVGHADADARLAVGALAALQLVSTLAELHQNGVLNARQQVVTVRGSLELQASFAEAGHPLRAAVVARLVCRAAGHDQEHTRGAEHARARERTGGTTAKRHRLKTPKLGGLAAARRPRRPF